MFFTVMLLQAGTMVHAGSFLKGTLIFVLWALVYSPCLLLTLVSLALSNSRLKTSIHSSICIQNLKGVTARKSNFISHHIMSHPSSIVALISCVVSVASGWFPQSLGSASDCLVLRLDTLARDTIMQLLLLPYSTTCLSYYVYIFIS